MADKRKEQSNNVIQLKDATTPRRAFEDAMDAVICPATFAFNCDRTEYRFTVGITGTLIVSLDWTLNAVCSRGEKIKLRFLGGFLMSYHWKRGRSTRGFGDLGGEEKWKYCAQTKSGEEIEVQVDVEAVDMAEIPMQWR